MTGENENGHQETKARSRRSLLQTLGVTAVGVGGLTTGAETVRAEADFNLEIQSVPDQVVAGQSSTEPLVVYVENNGDEADTQTIRVNIGLARRDVTLDAGQSTTVNFTLSPRGSLSGDQRLDVECEDDVERTRIRILEPAEHEIEIGEVDDRIVAGRKFSFDIEVTNVGEATETKEVEWSVEEKGSFGGLVASGDIQAGPQGGKTQTITRTVEAKETGNKELIIQAGGTDDAGSKTVQQIEPQDPAFEVSILTDGLGEPREGEELTVPVELFNTGDFEGTKEVTVSLGEQTLLTQELTLGRRSTSETNFTIPVPFKTAGQQNLTVSTESGGATKVIEVIERPRFEVELLEHNSPIPQEFAFEFQVQVTNASGVNGQDEVSVTVGELGSDSQSLELESGASDTVTLSVNAGQAEFGTYNATIQSAPEVMATDGMRSTTEVEVAEVPFFQINSVSTNAPVQAGADLEVTVAVTNTGSDTGTEEIQAAVPEVSESASSIELAIDEQAEETLVIGTAAGDAGEYELSVSGASTSTTQTITIQEAPQQSTPTPTPSSDGNGGNGGGGGGGDSVETAQDGNNAPGFGVGTALTSLGGAAYLLKRRLGDDEE
jgi:PGF-CTERM protein